MTELNPLIWQDDIRQALAADAANEWDIKQARLDAERVHQAGVEAEQIAAAKAAADAIAAEVQDAEPPAAIAAVTNGLSPQRARLVRYVAWLAALEAEHKSVVAGREKFLSDQGIAAMTKAAIAKLVADDKSGLVALMASGGEITQHQTRSAERKKLEAKLADDEHKCDVSVAALIDVEAKIDALAKKIEVVAARHKSFVADALSEIAAETAGANLTAKMDVLHDSALTVMGAHAAVLTLQGLAPLPRPHEMVLPTLRLAGDQWRTASEDRPGYYSGGAGYTVSWPVFQQEAEQRRWLERAKLLMNDPHADISGAQ